MEGECSSEATSMPVSYCFDKCKKALIEFIILDGMPFNIVERDSFQRLINSIEPRFEIPSETTVARECYKLYVDEKKKLKAFLKSSCKRVCLSVDTWKSVEDFNYMRLTAHFIDNDWKLQKRILNFCQVADLKGKTIGKEIEKCLRKWGIEKVFTVTVENSSLNDNVIDFLKRRLKSWDERNGLVCDGDFMHIICCAHTLNLVVNEELKDLHTSIASIRNAIRYVASFPTGLKKFRYWMEQENIPSRSFMRLDVPTRWNSTYMMLKHAEKFRKAFQRMEDDDELYKAFFLEDDNRVGPPTASDWDNSSIFVNFLQVFYDMMLNFSRSLYLTSNECFHAIASVQSELIKWSQHNDHLLCNRACNMRKKFEKYWRPENFNPLVFVVVVLDPRYKLDFLEWSFHDIYDDVMCSSMLGKVKDTLYRLYDFYSIEFSAFEKDKEEFGKSSGNMNDGKSLGKSVFESRFNLWKQQKRAKDDLDSQSELHRYFLEKIVNDDDESFNILDWWKVNASRYKVLSVMARDVLAIPISTMGSKCAFSTDGHVLDAFRSSLSPKMIEALICTQNWLSPKEKFDDDDEFDEFEDIENILYDFSGVSELESINEPMQTDVEEAL